MDILTSHTYYVPFLLAHKWIIIVSAIIFSAGIIAIFACNSSTEWLGLTGFIAMVIVAIFVVVSCCIETKEIDHIEYLATFNDNYTINELYKEYEIISIDGDIYTLIPRDGGNNG